MKETLWYIYKHDALAYFENVSGPEADRIRKDFITVCETNLKTENFPDETFNLTTTKI